jgi:hypothetical protein
VCLCSFGCKCCSEAKEATTPPLHLAVGLAAVPPAACLCLPPAPDAPDHVLELMLLRWSPCTMTPWRSSSSSMATSSCSRYAHLLESVQWVQKNAWLSWWFGCRSSSSGGGTSWSLLSSASSMIPLSWLSEPMMIYLYLILAVCDLWLLVIGLNLFILFSEGGSLVYLMLYSFVYQYSAIAFCHLSVMLCTVLCYLC